MSTTHTPGPWFADRHGRIWRRDPAELYENGGGVAGDKSLAQAYEGWYGDGLQGYPMHANARLIAAAPDLLEALESLMTLESRGRVMPIGPEWDKARAAIAKATGATVQRLPADDTEGGE